MKLEWPWLAERFGITNWKNLKSWCELINHPYSNIAKPWNIFGINEFNFWFEFFKTYAKYKYHLLIELYSTHVGSTQKTK